MASMQLYSMVQCALQIVPVKAFVAEWAHESVRKEKWRSCTTWIVHICLSLPENLKSKNNCKFHYFITMLKIENILWNRGWKTLLENLEHAHKQLKGCVQRFGTVYMNYWSQRSLKYFNFIWLLSPCSIFTMLVRNHLLWLFAIISIAQEDLGRQESRGRTGKIIKSETGTQWDEEVNGCGRLCGTLRKESSDPFSMNSVTIMTGRLLVTTPSRWMTLGCSNCPMMLASLRNSRRCSSV